MELESILLPGVEAKRPIVIAGPCSAETEEQVMDTAKQLAAKGQKIYRAGIWKPRTKPGGFEGIGVEGLAWLKEVKKETGMYVSTEVATAKHVYECLKAGIDILWVGARTTANPFAYIHSEKDILKLVTTLIANTKGEGKAGDDFWVKAETLLYCALIGYIHYEAPVEEQNFSTLIEFINAMEVREDDEEFKNPVDLMFDALEAEKPNHFAVRQYKKYKLAAGVVCSKRLLNQAVGKSLRTHNPKLKKGAQVMRKNEKITALYERLSRDFLVFSHNLRSFLRF